MKNCLSISGCLTSLLVCVNLACSAEATPPRNDGGQGAGAAAGTTGFAGTTFGGSTGFSGSTGFAGTTGTAGSTGFGGATGFAGTTGTAGLPGTGGSTGGTSKAAAGKIDDLEDGDNVIALPYVGYWYSYNDKSGTQTPPPEVTPGTAPWTPTAGGATSPGYAACSKGSGFTMWGAGIGFNINDLGMGRTATIDATGVTGISFMAKGTGTIRLQVSSAPTASPANGGTCAAATGCDYHANAPITLNAAAYAPVQIAFTQLSPGVAPFAPAQMLAIQFQAYSMTGTGPIPAFDFCIDDLAFY